MAGATKYEDGGTLLRRQGRRGRCFAGSSERLDQALERAEGDDHLDEDTFNAALEGLPGNAAARVYSDLQALIGSDPGGEQARKVEWVAALRTLGLTATRARTELELQLNVRTDPEGLSDEDLPIAAGDEAPPVLARDGEVGLGIRNPAQIVRFAEAAGQAVDPSGFGDYAQAKQTLDSRLDISIDDDLIGQLTRRPRGEHRARRRLRRACRGGAPRGARPARSRRWRTCCRASPRAPASAAVTIDKPAGGEGVYTLTQADGDDIAFGVVDGVLVVADDPAEAEELAAEEPEPVDGAEGAVAMRSDAEQLVNAVIEEFGPALGLSGFNALGRAALHRPPRGAQRLAVGEHRRAARPRCADLRLASGGPLLQQRQRVDRLAAVVPAAHPDLEVQVGAARAARVADLGERLPGAHVLPGGDHDRALAQVHEDVVAILVVAVEHDVPAGAAASGSARTRRARPRAPPRACPRPRPRPGPGGGGRCASPRSARPRRRASSCR